MIRLNDISICQGSFALTGVCLTVPTGRYGVLMGKTGCGKTSLLEAIAGLRPITAGTILLSNRDATKLPPGERGIGYVPQDAALFRTLSVYNHLAFALHLRDTEKPVIDQRVRELADWLGIMHLLERRPIGLSGGEAQRVALGRALSFRPKYLLLDEPLASLDAETRNLLIDVLAGIRKSGECTVLHVTHNPDEAERLADARFRLADGQLVQEN